MQREPAPELALVAASGGQVEISADATSDGGMRQVLWLRGALARRLMPTGFWVRQGGADVFFAPRGDCFNRAQFVADRMLPVDDPAPRVPDAWLMARPADMPPPSVARVTIDMLADGRLRIVATAGGRPDCRYLCTVDEALKRSLPEVLAELTQQCVSPPPDRG